MRITQRLSSDLREEISVLQGLIDAAVDHGVKPDDELLLDVYVDTLRKRQELLEDLEHAEREAHQRQPHAARRRRGTVAANVD
jgi:hypothetical protein